MAETLTSRVIKATSLLGSTQVINMLCYIVRTKMLTYWVGTIGVGLMGILTLTIELFSNFTQLNIRTTAVRDLAVIPPGQRGETIGIVRRVSTSLGCIGLILMFVLAPLLSRLAFDSEAYAWPFRIASLALLLQALQGSEHIILQAEGRFGQIASSGLIASIAGLLIALPLFLLLKTQGVAPAIVGYALAGWLVAAWFTRGYRSEARSLSLKQCFIRSRKFIEMGFYTVVAALIGNLISLGFSTFVQRTSGDVALSLYMGGNTMLVRYVGVFFTAIGVEFYPRLSAAINRPRYASLLITHQARVSTFLFLPCGITAILLTPWLIRLLYNEEFLAMSPYFIYGMVGMMMRPASTVLSFGFIAANKAKAYLITEILSSLVGFALNIAGYMIGGWTGLGLATALWYLFDILIIYIAARRIASPVYGIRTLLLSFASTAVMLAIAYLLA